MSGGIDNLLTGASNFSSSGPQFGDRITPRVADEWRRSLNSARMPAVFVRGCPAWSGRLHEGAGFLFSSEFIIRDLPEDNGGFRFQPVATNTSLLNNIRDEHIDPDPGNSTIDHLGIIEIGLPYGRVETETYSISFRRNSLVIGNDSRDVSRIPFVRCLQHRRYWRIYRTLSLESLYGRYTRLRATVQLILTMHVPPGATVTMNVSYLFPGFIQGQTQYSSVDAGVMTIIGKYNGGTHVDFTDPAVLQNKDVVLDGQGFPPDGQFRVLAPLEMVTLVRTDNTFFHSILGLNMPRGVFPDPRMIYFSNLSIDFHTPVSKERFSAAYPSLEQWMFYTNCMSGTAVDNGFEKIRAVENEPLLWEPASVLCDSMVAVYCGLRTDRPECSCYKQALSFTNMVQCFGSCFEKGVSYKKKEWTKTEQCNISTCEAQIKSSGAFLLDSGVQTVVCAHKRFDVVTVSQISSASGTRGRPVVVDLEKAPPTPPKASDADLKPRQISMSELSPLTIAIYVLIFIFLSVIIILWTLRSYRVKSNT